MTDSQLADFEGVAVSTASVEIRNAAGGLQDALKVSPESWHHGDEMTIVLRCSVTKIRFDPIKDSEALARVHVLTASDATVIDSAAVEDALDDQARRIEEHAGVVRLPFLVSAHEAGEHASGLVDGCPSCQEEIDAMAEGE